MSNQITFTVEISDSLLNTLANILVMSNTPMLPTGSLPPELLAMAKAQAAPSGARPIGFRQGDSNESR